MCGRLLLQDAGTQSASFCGGVRGGLDVAFPRDRGTDEIREYLE